MKVKAVQLTEFKRFSSLKISGIPETAKLVVITGPNGSGKSGIFEAFNYWKRPMMGFGGAHDDGFFAKSVAHLPNVHVEFHDGAPDQTAARRAFYQRSAYRHDAEFKNTKISQQQSMLDQAPPNNLIGVETKVRTNYDRLTSLSLAGMYNPDNDEKRVVDLRDEYIGVLRQAMEKIFEGLVLDSPGNPIEDGTFMFTKGISSGFLYKNLSGGEKAAFDLLIDFVASREVYIDSIYCIDEPELHMGSRVQARLLEQLVKLLPDGCQLWVATHSLGMMRQAGKLQVESPESVCFLDTSEHDFDDEVEMTPVEPTREFWKQILHVALDDVASLVAPETVYVCEGDPTANVTVRDFDAKVYKTIFGASHPDVEFVSAGGSGTLSIVADSLTTIAPGSTVRMVRDRDSLTPQAVADSREEGFLVLSERDLENYLLSDEVLTLGCELYIQPEIATESDQAGDSDVQQVELHDDVTPDEQSDVDPAKETHSLAVVAAKELIAQKQALLEAATHGDDVKSIAGQIFEACKARWTLSQAGLNRHMFMRDVCAPLITPETETYAALKADLELS